MTLKELIEKAVTLPLTIEMERVSEILWEPTIYQRNAHPDQQWVADLPTWPSEAPPPLAALLVHAVNLLPELVKQLEKAVTIIDGEYPESQHAETGLPEMRALLEKANTIEIK